MRSAFFSLDPPPGFRPFDPHGEITSYQRRLPHWRQEAATYFVTFRLADSLPAEALAKLEALKREWAEDLESRECIERWTTAETKAAWDERSRHAIATIEHWLDQGIGDCLLRDGRTREVLMDSLLHNNGEEAELSAVVIMPNHAHLIVRPLGGNPLETYLQRRKRHSAREINRLLERRGRVWQEESFDRIVRDTEHLWRCLQYVGRNPRKANVSHPDCTLWVCDDWAAAGWNFVDENPD
jgi:REP element-mobilizing transposase RayT